MYIMHERFHTETTLNAQDCTSICAFHLNWCSNLIYFPWSSHYTLFIIQNLNNTRSKLILTWCLFYDIALVNGGTIYYSLNRRFTKVRCTLLSSAYRGRRWSCSYLWNTLNTVTFEPLMQYYVHHYIHFWTRSESRTVYIFIYTHFQRRQILRLALNQSINHQTLFPQFLTQIKNIHT